MDAVTLLLFAVGLGLLVLGAEALVRGASRLAAAVGISPLVIGLTVVGYATSSPELAVSLQAALSGQADIALGNVVGSNIFNVLFILGSAALLAPLVVAQQLVRLEVPLMIGASVLLLVLALNGQVGRLDGALLFAGAVAYTIFAIRKSRNESEQVIEEYAHEFGVSKPQGGRQVAVQIGLIIVGVGLLVLGSRWLVGGAVALATAFGLSELVIGLTIIAAGTGLPEAATSIIATVRGERDIAVGNAIGSSIFNILLVLGLTSLVAPGGIQVPLAVLTFDIPVMIGTALACFPIFFTGSTIARWEGALFLGYYLAYVVYLLMAATRHGSLPVFGAAMLFFVIPLTTVTLLVLLARAVRADRVGKSA